MSLNLDKSTWKRVCLGDVVYRSRKQVNPSEARVERYVAGGHVDGDSITIDRWGDPNDGQMGSTFRYAVEPGQILFVSARPYLRKSGVVDFSGVVADKTYVLDASPESGLLQAFLPFILVSDPFIEFATAEATGSMNPRLLWGPFQKYEFALPPLDEQKRIADLLWAVERHRVNTLSSEMEASKAKSLMLAERLASGAEERGWPLEPVSELVTSGPTNGKSARANDEQRGVPTLSISAVRDGGVRGGDSVKWIEVDPDSVSSFRLQPSDFLVVRGNGNRSLTGRGGLVKGDLPVGCIYPDLLIRLRFNPDRMLPAFAAEQWNSAAVHASLLENAKSTNGIWKINGKDIKSHQLVVPPLKDQVRILEETASFDEALDALQTEVSALEALRTAFLGEIFGGN